MKEWRVTSSNLKYPMLDELNPDHTNVLCSERFPSWGGKFQKLHKSTACQLQSKKFPKSQHIDLEEKIDYSVAAHVQMDTKKKKSKE